MALSILATFPGGFSQSAAAEVAGMSPFFLDALTAKKILRLVKPQRYSMHHMLAQFAAAQLEARPARALAGRRRHSVHYLKRLTCASAQLKNGLGDLQPFAADFSNFLRAWDQALHDRSIELLFSSVDGMIGLLVNLGRFQDGINLCNRSIAALNSQNPGCLETRLLSCLLVRLAGFNYHVGLYPEGLPLLDQAAALLEQTALLLDQAAVDAGPAAAGGKSLDRDRLEVLRIKAKLYGAMGDYERSLALAVECLALVDPLVDPDLAFALLNSAGVTAYMNQDYPLAMDYYDQALVIARRADDAGKIAMVLNNQGNVAYDNGDYTRALPLLEQAMAACAPLDNTTLYGAVLDSLGKTCTAAGDYAGSVRCFSEGLRLMQEIDCPPIALEMLVGVAELMLCQDDPLLALALANLVAAHPATPHDVRTRAAAHCARLESHGPAPAQLAWPPEQLRRVTAEIIEMLKR
jgi:tetratricopeptide (TPR) repeat protein